MHVNIKCYLTFKRCFIYKVGHPQTEGKGTHHSNGRRRKNNERPSNSKKSMEGKGERKVYCTTVEDRQRRRSRGQGRWSPVEGVGGQALAEDPGNETPESEQTGTVGSGEGIIQVLGHSLELFGAQILKHREYINFHHFDHESYPHVRNTGLLWDLLKSINLLSCIK